MTVSQVREIFTRLLRSPAPSPERIAEVVSRVLWRKEAARIYKWHKATGKFPPCRSGQVCVSLPVFASKTDIVRVFVKFTNSCPDAASS